MRICLVYDCLYPHTVGGAERWYRNLGERLAADGHEVTYVTLRQWEQGDSPDVPGVDVVTVGPRLALYTEGGRRRIGPPLRFGAGVFSHMLRNGGRYDVVHTASFPYFSLLALGLAQRVHRFRLIVDWHEVWTREYWREYLGPRGGAVGALVQRLCARLGDRAFCFSQLHARRLRHEGFRGIIGVLPGEYAGSLEPPLARDAEPVVVFAGRHIPEKRVPALVPAIAAARGRIPGLRCEILGDGPERERVQAEVAAQGLEDVVSVPGFVSSDEVERALESALCLVLPSRREGYGLVVVEASARATPAVVVAGPDNAATELIDEGENGFVAADASPEAIAEAIVRVHEAGRPLRDATAAWFARNAGRLSIDGSLETVALSYAADDPAARR